MVRYVVLLILSLCLAHCGSRNVETTKRDSLTSSITPVDSLEKTKQAYSRAIAEYLIAAYQTEPTLPDTLFIGKHDQFPQIQLPNTIEGVVICVLTNEEYEPKTKYRAHSVFINMIGTSKGNHWDFKMVVFYDWAKPQHNFNVSFDYVPELEKFVTDSLYFEYVYGKK